LNVWHGFPPIRSIATRITRLPVNAHAFPRLARAQRFGSCEKSYWLPWGSLS
jgi:hypothetical protein